MVPAANPSAAPDTPDHFDTYFMSTPRTKPGAVSIVLGGAVVDGTEARQMPPRCH
jgi:hypothetical protein